MAREAVPTNRQRVHRLQAQCTPDMLDTVRKLARRKGVSESVILRWAVTEYIAREEKQPA